MDNELQLDSIYFSRELEEMLGRIYEKRRAPLNMEKLLPIIDISDPDMERFTARAVDHSGEAHKGRISEPGCKTDVPNISLSMTEESYRICRWKMGVNYTDREIRVARKLGKQLDTRLAEAALYELFRFENEFLTNGDAASGAKGLFDPTLMTQGTLATGSWDGATTSEQLYADLQQMALAIETQTDCVYMDQVDIVLPCAAYNLINGKQYSPGTDTTVLQYFQRNWSQKVRSVTKAREFDTANRAMVFIRDDRYMGRIRVPVRQVGPVRSELCEETTIHMEMGSSGIIVFDSLAQTMFGNVLA